VVVILLIALRGDMMRRCRSLGILCARCSCYCVGNARVGGRRGVCNFFELVAGNAAVGPYYD
jgi:hypothetical protein